MSKDIKQEDLRLINDLTHLSEDTIETMLSKLHIELLQDLKIINQDYQENIQQIFEREQSQLLNQFEEQIEQLKSLQIQAEKNPNFKQQAKSLQLQNHKFAQILKLGIQGQNSLIQGLLNLKINEVQPQPQMSPPQSSNEVTNNQAETISNLKSTDPLPKITCSLCGKSDLEVFSFRRHLRDEHELAFTGYRCGGACEFHNKWIDQFCNHIIQVHKKKTCACGKSFLTKIHFCEHLRSCLKFYHRNQPAYKKKKIHIKH